MSPPEWGWSGPAHHINLPEAPETLCNTSPRSANTMSGASGMARSPYAGRGPSGPAPSGPVPATGSYSGRGPSGPAPSGPVPAAGPYSGQGPSGPAPSGS